jgi:stearoyl-CoA desaturase (delta-9 desaturase)
VGTAAHRKEAEEAMNQERRQEPESIAIVHGGVDRAIQGVATGAPLAALVVTAGFAWGAALHWQDLLVLAILYVITGLGITVGYHRLFTHRSFKTSRGSRATFAVLGSMAVEGSVVEWVATHRRHHDFSDKPGDPHSPHVDVAPGWRGALKGLAHAHVGWLFGGKQRANPARYARDLLNDRDMRLISRTFPLWIVAGLAIAFGLGVALSGSVAGGLTGLLWGGGVRIFLLHHATFSINSLCHYFGCHRFRTGDESRNLARLAPITFGESWHNNHHPCPTSARHGLRRRQLDLGGWVIDGLERLGLAWDVVRVPADKQLAKQLAGG